MVKVVTVLGVSGRSGNKFVNERCGASSIAVTSTAPLRCTARARLVARAIMLMGHALLVRGVTDATRFTGRQIRRYCPAVSAATSHALDARQP